MTTTDTYIANQAHKVEATKAQIKSAEPRRADDDTRFTEELRASRAEDKRIAEERARERRADETRAEDARKAEARDAAARTESARAEDARAQDAQAEKEQEEKSREEHASDKSDGTDASAAEDGAGDADGIEQNVQVAVTQTVTGAAAETQTPDTPQIVGDDVAVEETAANTATTDATAPGQQAALSAVTPAKADAATTSGTQNDGTPNVAAAAKSDAVTSKAAQAAPEAVKPDAQQTGKTPSGDTAATSPQAAAATKAKASLEKAIQTPVEAEAAISAKAAEAAGKRGLGHATAEAMQETKADTKPKSTPTATPQTAPSDATADKSTTTVQTAQRSAASEIALQAALAKPTGAPQDIRIAGLDAGAAASGQAADSAAPAPSVTVRAIVSATSLPGTPAQPQTPAREIAVNMARNLSNGTNRFEIRLDPAELGRIDVRMELGTDGRVQAHLTVDKPETLEMLQRDARALEKALSDAGLDMENGSLEYSLRDDSQGSGFAANRDDTETASSTTQSEDELAADLAAVQHIYSLKAGSGTGVDIRI